MKRMNHPPVVEHLLRQVPSGIQVLGDLDSWPGTSYTI